MKKPTLRSLTRKLDKECSRIVRARGRCARCNGDEYSKLQAAHIFSRVYRSVRFNLDNILVLCASCHFYFHRNPVLFGEFVREYLGKLKYTELKLQATAIKKWKVCELEELLRGYEKIC